MTLPILPSPSGARIGPPNGRIYAFDGLRGAAAFVVVVFHYLAMLHPNWVPNYSADPPILVDTPVAILWNGPFAVSIFFVLSGFVMAASAERRRDRIIGNAVARYLRLSIPAAASVLLAYAWLSLFPTAATDLARASSGPSDWLAYTVQAPLPGIQAAAYDGLIGTFITGGSSFNNVLWTMQIELIGSLALFIVYWAGGIHWWLRFLALAGFAAFGLFILRDAYLCFVGGALLYEAHRSCLLQRLPAAIGPLALMVGILLGAPGEGFAERWGLDFLPERLQPGNAWGLAPVVAAIAILLSVQLLPRAKALLEVRSLQWLGRISFGLYLVHVPILYTLVAWERVEVGLPEPVVVAAYIAIVLALAHVFTLAIDEPTMRLLGRLAPHLDAMIVRLRVAPRSTLAPQVVGGIPPPPAASKTSGGLELPTQVRGDGR
jgi:peptidoglycan/LPS O-acetylase OafA/YrhL